MKRNKPAKRRDRMTGQSPYEKHQKRETLYSAGYQEWKRSVTGKAKRELAGAHRANHKAQFDRAAAG